MPKQITNIMKRVSLHYKETGDGSSRTFQLKNAGNYALAQLSELRDNRNLCDIILMVDGVEVPAHRCILVISSDYFRAMFADGFHETKAEQVALPAGIVDVHAAETLVNYMYTGQFTVTPDTVQGLIMAADHWQMSLVKDECVKFMERQIDPSNCLGVLWFGELYRCERLVQQATQTIKQRFGVVAESCEFLHLSARQLERILKFPDLNLGHEGEDIVLRAAMRWLDYQPERIQDLAFVLRKIRLNTVSKDRCKQLLDHPLISSSKDLVDLVEELVSHNTESRVAPTTLYVIGGFLQSRTGAKCPRLRSVERLDPVTQEWWLCAQLPVLGSGSVALNLHGQLFCAAYEPVETQGRTAASLAVEAGIFHYSAVRDEWSDAKTHFSLETLMCIQDCLEAEGAVTVCPTTSAIYTVSCSEVYCISVNLIDGQVYCRDQRLLPFPRDFFTPQQRLHSAVVLNGRLYVLGGDRHDGGSDPVPTSRVIMLDPQQNRWVARANMREPRAKMGAVVLGGHIYVCGGFNVRRLTSLERYDPVTDSWTSLRPMQKFRSHHAVLVQNGKIWAIGGKSYSFNNGGARKVVNSCEVYDPRTDTWTEGASLNAARCAFAAVAI